MYVVPERRGTGVARKLLHALEAHPGIAQVAVANIPTTERAMVFAENLLALLLALTSR